MKTAVEMTSVDVSGDSSALTVSPQPEEIVPEVAGVESPAGSSPPTVLSPAEWARQVLGITAPFGRDRLPTVWG